MRTNLLTLALVATTALAAVPASARDRDYRDRETFVVTPNQVVDMADARIAQLKADLRLNPDQDKNWGSLQNALHAMAQRRADRMTKLREQRSAAATETAPGTTAPGPTAAPANLDPNAPPADMRDREARDRDARDRDTRDRADRDSRDRAAPDMVAEMRRQADAMTDRAEDYRKFADAAVPLYGSLDEGQKRRFVAFAQRNLMEEPDGPAYRR